MHVTAMLFGEMLDFVWLFDLTGASVSQVARVLRKYASDGEGRIASFRSDATRERGPANLTPDQRFRIELHSSPEPLKDDWRAFETTAIGTPFQSYAWISAWCRHAARAYGEIPLIVVGRDAAGTLAFIWPFAIVRRFGVDFLSWLGQKHAGYGFGLFRRDAMEQIDAGVLRALLRDIGAQRPGLAGLYLIKQPIRWCGIVNPFAAIEQHPCDIEIAAFSLQRDFEALFNATISAKRRADQRRLLTQLRKRAAVSIDIARDLDQRLEMYDAFRVQKGAQLACGRRCNAFADPAIDAFYRDLLQRADDHAPLEIGYMRVDHDIAAVDIVVHFNGRTYGLNRSITDGELKRFAPGRQLNCHLVARACWSGDTVYDLGPGVAAYKDEWKGYSVPLFTTIATIRLRGVPAVALHSLLVHGKALLKRFPHVRELARDAYRRLGRLYRYDV